MSNSEWVERTEAVLQESVDAHMVADVEVGTFLSGGVDSSLVTSAAANGRSSIRAYTINFKNEPSTEGVFAQDVANRIGLENHILTEVESASLNLVDKLVHFYDEPFSDSSMFPTFLVCESSSSQLKVCLSGDGGDELFSGYRHHLFASRLNWTTRLPDFLMRSMFDGIGRLLKSDRRSYEWSRRLSQSAEKRMQSFMRVPGNAYRIDLLNAEYRENRDEREWQINRYLEQTKDLPPVTRAQMFDILFYLPGDMLTKVDRASMANSLEVRVPFLSKKVAEFALSIPEHQRFHDRQAKYILRELMRKKFGTEHSQRRKKGFSIPLIDWLRNFDRQRLLDLTVDSKPVKHGILNRHAVDRMFQNVVSTKRKSFVESSSATDLFSVLFFSVWWSKNLG